VFLINEPSSSWRDDLLNLIYKTTKIAYLSGKHFKYYSEHLLKTPAIGVVTEHPDITTKCEDLSKAILSLYAMIKSEAEGLDKAKIKEITHRIICEAISRLYPSDTELSTFFEILNVDALKNLNFS
jgi:acetate kinase